VKIFGLNFTRYTVDQELGTYLIYSIILNNVKIGNLKRKNRDHEKST